MNMEIFRNSEFGSIRVIEEDGKYLFCGSDVAKALGYSNPRKAVRDHARGGTKRSIPTASGDQTMTFLPEDSNAAQDILEESIIRRHNLVRLEDVEEPQDEGDLEGDEVWSD